MLQNEPLVAKIGVDTAENEPIFGWIQLVQLSIFTSSLSSPRSQPAAPARPKAAAAKTPAAVPKTAAQVTRAADTRGDSLGSAAACATTCSATSEIYVCSRAPRLKEDSAFPTRGKGRISLSFSPHRLRK